MIDINLVSVTPLMDGSFINLDGVQIKATLYSKVYDLTRDGAIVGHIIPHFGKTSLFKLDGQWFYGNWDVDSLTFFIAGKGVNPQAVIGPV